MLKSLQTTAFKFVTLACIVGQAITGALAGQPAKQAFGAQALPADMQPQSVGFYSKGCMAGGVAIPVDGLYWQVMRLSRNRRWGHPVLIKTLDELSLKARRDGWNGLMVGDISQPRGGPMLTGHASHQTGLDADLWFMPMPQKRLSYQEREDLSAISVLKDHSNFVDDKRWTRAHELLLRHAAAFAEVERILVHPGVKKKLCDTVRGERAWLAKIRPYYSHHYHFHLRIGCQDGSPACKQQVAVAKGEGCDASLEWWFKVALAPKKPKKDDDPEKPRRPIMVSDLPHACAAVLKAADKPQARAEYKTNAAFAAPRIEIPAYDAKNALASRPIEQKGIAVSLEADPADAAPAVIPIPARRPLN